jgi:hypothetical protein
MSKRSKGDFFLTVPGDDRLGLVINLPAALRGGGLHQLPPHAPVRGSLVDCFPACPADWPRSSGSMASYFVPIIEGRGLWLNFNRCADHPHHVAAVVSIQGVNPLTGRKADKLELEAYPDDDSVEKWLRGRQNYLATTSTPDGLLWIDGFRAKDGTVRQYVFTKEERRGVAAQLIGVDRVFAIGAAFFLSKEPKPPTPKVRGRTQWVGLLDDGALMAGAVPSSADWKIGAPLNLDGGSAPTVSNTSIINVANAGDATSYCMSDASTGILRSMAAHLPEPHVFMAVSEPTGLTLPGVTTRETDKSLSLEADADAATLEIAAGAEIDQMLYKDTVGLDFWQPKCAGVVVVSYAPAEIVRRILAAGEVPEPEGFLEGLEVGSK